MYSFSPVACHEAAHAFLVELTLRDYFTNGTICISQEEGICLTQNRVDLQKIDRGSPEHFALLLGRIVSTLAGSYSEYKFFNRAMESSAEYLLAEEMHQRFKFYYAPHWTDQELFFLYYHIIDYSLLLNRRKYFSFVSMLQRNGILYARDIKKFFQRVLLKDLPKHLHVDQLYKSLVEENKLLEELLDIREIVREDRSFASLLKRREH